MNFCTYFDENYLPKGIACYKTLYNYGSFKNLFVVCLDEKTYSTVKNLPKLTAILLSDIEVYDADYVKTKNNRTKTAYYITMSPILPLYIFDKFKVDKVFYTDADMAFWNNPKEIEDIMGSKSLMITDHGIEPPRGGIRFNNGIMGYRNDKYCKEFLYWWREKCLEWCNWNTENGKCGEQGWLNIVYDEPNKFKNTLICPQPGVNCGPWCVAKYGVKLEDNKLKIFTKDKSFNLISYHYHEFRYLSENSYYPTGWAHTQQHRNLIYDPYFNLIKQVRKELNYNKVDLVNIGKK